jgi:outer membrane receptor protein involved in Fe transport
MFKKIVLSLAVLTLIPLTAYSQVSGTIAGTVMDKETGDPLPGVNITVDGTFRGANTDIDGFFRILNMPAGGYTVRAAFIGYREMVVQDVNVSVDHTTPIDFKLESTTLELQETIVVTAERELIRRDETNTQVIATAEDISIMPVRGVEDIAALTAGVVKADNNQVINVRGGRGGESAFYVDGVLVNDPHNNAVRVYLPNDAIEEMSVQTGGFNAEYGDAMSGIVITTTKSGGTSYHGSFEVITDEFLSKDSKELGLGTYSYGYNEYTGAFSGPIIPKTNHTFFLSGTRRWIQDHTPSWGWSENENKPDQFKGGPIPGNVADEWSASGKLQFHINPEMNFRASGSWTDRTFGTSFLELGLGSTLGMNPLWVFNTGNAPQWATEHRSVNATFTHTPTPTTFYDVKLNYFWTFRENYDRAFGDDLMKYGDPRYNPLPDIDANFGQSYNTKIEPLDYFAPGAQFDDYFKNKTTYWSVDIDLTHQADKYNTLKAGFEYRYHTLRQFRMLEPVKLASRADLTELERYRLSDVQFYGYDMYGNEVDDGTYFNTVRDESGQPVSGFQSQAPYNPIIMSAYLQDKIEFEDLVLNLGLRFDYIDPNAWQFKQGAAEFDEDGNYIEGTGMFGGDEIFSEADVKPSESFSFISPRLGFAFPVSESTVFHGQFGKFYQPPRLQDLYLSPFYLDSWVNRGGYFTNLTNPNLEPPKTTSYEIGFKQGLGSVAALRLTAFYKETTGLVQLIPLQTDVTEIAFSANGDFGVVRGLDIMLTMRRYKNFMAKFNYELQIANGTGSGTLSNFDIAWQNGGAGNYPKFTQPLNFEQRHTGSLILDYREGPEAESWVFRNTGLNFVFVFNSGRPYTRMQLQNQFPFSGRYDNDGISEIPYSAVNAEQTPWTFNLSLRLDRRFPLPLNTALTLSIQVLNTLNTGNVKNVWTTTGSPDRTGYLSTTAGSSAYQNYSAEEKKLYDMREMDYMNYGIPRQIRLGAKLEF